MGFLRVIWVATKHTESALWRMALLAIVTLNISLLLLFFILFNRLERGQSDLNVLAVSITVLEIMLAVTAVGGFWLIRSSAMTRAGEAAEEVSAKLAEKAARDWLEENAPPLIARKVLESKGLADPESAEQDTDLKGFADSLGDE